ncbi:hypothetical protein [Ferviditalea candida]|uniref:Uncharacterized protein n=1 Tax=Ferviditalea candida TaxID=3108399 RepID=A0ABU5ZIF6_9BACL|nr:hypothetical protein [Paenibacillaceae bacterium T2]
MDQSAILFQFDDSREAEMAFETLKDLGYEPVLQELADKPSLHIHVENNDLTSALEIAQAHGGTLLETSKMDVGAMLDTAYGMEGIRIPAHTVNEDWPAGYAHE